MVEIVRQIEDLEEGMLPKEDEFQSDIIECNLSEWIPVTIRVRSKAGGLDHAPNVIVRVKMPLDYGEIFDLDESFKVNELEGEGDLVKMFKELETVIEENTKADEPVFEKEKNTGEFLIYNCSVERED